VPLLALGIDSVLPTHVLNKNYFLKDVLTMLSGVGCVASSMITILIFFPRSYEQEAGYRFRVLSETIEWENPEEGLKASRLYEKASQDGFEGAPLVRAGSTPTTRLSSAFKEAKTEYTSSLYESEEFVGFGTVSADRKPQAIASSGLGHEHYADHGFEDLQLPPIQMQRTTVAPLRPRRHPARRQVWGVVETAPGATKEQEDGLYPPFRPNADTGGTDLESLGRRPSLHPIVAKFTSPIDFIDA